MSTVTGVTEAEESLNAQATPIHAVYIHVRVQSSYREAHMQESAGLRK